MDSAAHYASSAVDLIIEDGAMSETIELKGQYEAATVYSNEPVVAVRDNVISPIECLYLIELAKPHIKRAGVVLDDGYRESDGRTGSNHWLKYEEDDVVKSIGQRLADIVGLPLTNAESMQIIHYGPTQEYRPHFDAFNLSQPRGQRAAKWGGQRLVTALVYLNQPESGGSTEFPKLGIKVPALPGRMVIFHNTDEDMSGPHPLSLHAGMPVEAGEKWAFNLWFRHGETSKSYSITADDDLPKVKFSTGAAAKAQSPTLADPSTHSDVPNRLTVISNRAEGLWQEAVANLKRRHGDSLEAAHVSYWDSYGNNEAPEAPTGFSAPIYSTASRSVLNPLSDQREFSRLLKQTGCASIAPATYESIEDVKTTQPDPQQLWFIKSRMRSAKDNTLCVPTAVLLAASLPANHVVQAGVSNIELIANRKFTYRCYLVMVDGCLHAFQNGVVFVHGAPYVPTQADFTSQVDNKSYREPDSGIDVLPMTDTEHAEALLAGTASLAKAMQPALLALSNECKGQKFAILGLDTLLKRDGQLSLIRVHSFPNFVMTRDINDAVHLPLFENILKLMVGRNSDLLTPLQ
ncbi:MAG: hypothetical protein CNF01_00395 [Halieaceae bacterium MED-G27]|nr:MAG: hypothetical protein CNF01_00395 [Halieaceae bacterium MED-G27]